jgi:hypothetical protein
MHDIIQWNYKNKKWIKFNNEMKVGICFVFVFSKSKIKYVQQKVSP